MPAGSEPHPRKSGCRFARAKRRPAEGTPLGVSADSQIHPKCRHPYGWLPFWHTRRKRTRRVRASEATLRRGDPFRGFGGFPNTPKMQPPVWVAAVLAYPPEANPKGSRERSDAPPTRRRQGARAGSALCLPPCLKRLPLLFPKISLRCDFREPCNNPFRGFGGFPNTPKMPPPLRVAALLYARRVLRTRRVRASEATLRRLVAGKAPWQAARYACRLACCACRSSSQKSRFAAIFGSPDF